MLPWIVISGLVFSILSYVANRYHGKERSNTQLAQDFVGGSVFLGLLSAVVPDIFPDISSYIGNPISGIKLGDATKVLENTLAKVSSTPILRGGSRADDIELQVGPLP